MTKPKINWPKDYPVSKYSLEMCIRQWVIEKSGRPYAPSFRYLSQMTLDDLVLMAMAMGYKPNPQHLAVIQATDARHKATKDAARNNQEARMAKLAAVVQPSVEEAEDQLDVALAEERLREIAQNPTKVLRGQALDAHLAEWSWE